MTAAAVNWPAVARMLGAKPPAKPYVRSAEWWRQKRAAVWAKTNGRCAYCGNTLPRQGWTVDHVVPRRGKLGRRSGEVSNMLPACQPCNVRKGDKMLDEWRATFGAGHRFWFERETRCENC